MATSVLPGLPTSCEDREGLRKAEVIAYRIAGEETGRAAQAAPRPRAPGPRPGGDGRDRRRAGVAGSHDLDRTHARDGRYRHRRRRSGRLLDGATPRRRANEIDGDRSTVNSFIFDFYAQGTTDATFPKATAFTSGWTNNHTKSTFILQAPYTGTFVLAACENVIPCSVASKNAVMNPYTFTTRLIAR